jgi:hypothetical protein
MLSERYRPKGWDDFVGQPVIDEIKAACGDSWLFDGCGERWLFESDGIAGCGKTSAAYVAARALGCSDFAIERIDSRSACVADFRELEGRMLQYGWSGNGRRCFIIDVVIGTTTSVTWADEVDGLYSRWRRFRFRKPDAKCIADHLERIARELSLPVPEGFRFLNYVQGKYGDGRSNGNNVRDCIDQLPDTLRRYASKAA